jgi:hypothetical protein
MKKSRLRSELHAEQGRLLFIVPLENLEVSEQMWLILPVGWSAPALCHPLATGLLWNSA